VTCAEAGAAVNTEEAANATTTATENLKHRTMLMVRRPEADPDKDHCCCRQRSSWPESSKSWRITYQGAARHHPWRRIAERTVCPLSQRHYSHRAPRQLACGYAQAGWSNLKRIRLKKGLTQEQFANISGFSQ
jgi:hypothetical protein